MDNSFELPELPDPLDYCYEWDGAWGTRKFSPNQYNGRGPDRSVALFTADQMLDYALAAVKAEREACAKLAAETVCDVHLPTGVRIYGSRVAKEIRARGKP